MIIYDYDYIYQNLKIRGYTLDFLREEKILSQSTIQHIRHNQPINTKTIDILCTLLDCQPQDIMKYCRNKADLKYINTLESYLYGRPFTEGSEDIDPKNISKISWSKTIDLRNK